MPEIKKRETAHKLRVGDLIRGNQIFDQTPSENLTQTTNPRLLYVELGNKKIVRVNTIANVIDKYESEGESKFAAITVDDGSGQIKIRVFGEDVKKFQDLVQGDTIIIIGLVRSFNQELYILPEIIKKQEPKYLLVRKLEIEKTAPKTLTIEQKQEIKAYRDEVIDLIKSSEENQGIDKEEIIMKFKTAKPNVITQEIQKLLEEGIIYEPKPGRVRYLG
ncbi:MAG: OB-fold nucleic acid binding domain-containing protein [archaeon]